MLSTTITQSPMFKHAIESFEHGIEHYMDGSPRSRKFAILHIDHAIELLLKEKAVSLGKSIYKTNGQTLSLHETFKALREIQIPEQPRLEEIHDLRNTIQHKGLAPDEATTEFSNEIAYSFFKRFLVEEFGIEINFVLPNRFITFMEGLPFDLSTDSRQALEEARQCASPTETIIRAYTALEQLTKQVGDEKKGKVLIRRTIKQVASDRGVPDEKIRDLLEELFSIRGRVVHSDHIPSREEANRVVDLAEELLSLMGG